MYGDRSFIYPTPAEEFDAHRHKMKVKHENIHETKWYDRTRGRNIFRYEPQFPNFTEEYRGSYPKHESLIFEENARQLRKDYTDRGKQNYNLIEMRKQIIRTKEQERFKSKKLDVIGEYFKRSGTFNYLS